MKICHLGDSHLGAGVNHPRRGETGLTLRQEDIIAGFAEAIDKIIALRPDLVIHAGDIFDAVRPLNKVMAVTGEHLHRLAETAGIPTILISGNHDAPKQPHIGAPVDIYRQIDNLYIASSGRLEIFRLDDTAVYALPHCLTGQMLQQELARCRPDNSAKTSIFVGHGVIAGMPEFAMADLGEQEIDLGTLDGFDYIALGHYHNYCEIGPRAWYCGSTERLSQSEREFAKGFLEINLDPFSVTFHEVHTRPMVDIQPIDATGKRGDELAALIKSQVDAAGSRDKIIRLRVEGVTEETLKTIPNDILTDLKQTSWSLDLSFQKAKTDNAEQTFGRSAIGRLDQEFLRFLETIDLKGFDRDRLKESGLAYLSQED